MKKLSLTLLLILMGLVVFLVIKPPIIIKFEKNSIAALPKPPSVPAEAIWIGGGGSYGTNFIIVKPHKSGNHLFDVKVYDDRVGKLEYSGTLEYFGDEAIDKKLNDPRLYKGWHEGTLYLTNDEYMREIKPAK